MKRNRWLIALSAMGLHLCIGSVYAWSVLTKPIMELPSKKRRGPFPWPSSSSACQPASWAVLSPKSVLASPVSYP